jgi:hypothetical protein
MWEMGYQGEHYQFNGDSAFIFVKRPEPEITPLPQGTVMTYTTSDSLIQKPIKQLGEHMVEKLQRYENIGQINEDYTIKGNDWMVFENTLIVNDGSIQHKIEIK